MIGPQEQGMEPTILRKRKCKGNLKYIVRNFKTEDIARLNVDGRLEPGRNDIMDGLALVGGKLVPTETGKYGSVKSMLEDGRQDGVMTRSRKWMWRLQYLD